MNEKSDNNTRTNELTWVNKPCSFIYSETGSTDQPIATDPTCFLTAEEAFANTENVTAGIETPLSNDSCT